ncbi:MAG: ATP:cob(I)alamin adenosyltransferase [Parcubacteria group bacterium Greene0714_21]|nr:MAG: ATP:cob(I)alamin adenosyltransferase [Parcubacteria group bacterium Greene0416_39]TSC98186.1 MAG: ATP:cob(I)alamin adenosyltransferase [Parcubacteria group bacterium Greene1014_47]TSD04056.1 MAG: ATP:cob(I)alamin adenosyltransferase [Parcubacteria group bacterium Greene0714_21]
MLFYTGKGDKGSSVIGKKKFPKDSPVPEVLGELDELNSLIGLFKSTEKGKPFFLKLTKVQETLFIIQARIAWILYPKFSSPQVLGEKIKELEKEIERAEKTIHPERGFVISGTNETSSWLDYLRAVARRVERRAYTLSRLRQGYGGQAKKYAVPKEILAYLNRLSSYLYALARLEIHKKKLKEPKPSYK